MGRWTRLVAVSLPALLIAALVAAIAIEIIVRLRWDPRRGTPGLYSVDPVLGQRLTPGYDGWFAGVPVHINALGFRDARDYDLQKRPNTFRILVLGDSVTFGHGCLFETTYPRLLEERLRTWKPDVDWQVWNLSVPGYNTSQELAQLRETATRWEPDLAIVSFYINDLDDNAALAEPGWTARRVAALETVAARHWYSLEWYKRVALTAAWRLSKKDAFHDRLANLDALDRLFAQTSDVRQLPEQRLTPLASVDGPMPACDPAANASSAREASLLTAELAQGRRWQAWTDAVHALQRINREAPYRVLFFLNVAPDQDARADRFCEGGNAVVNASLLRVMGDGGTPAVSAFDAIARFRPSQLPVIDGHAIGNSNRVKADALFDYLVNAKLVRSE
jgi:GDSL-like lipase/acylhydrolase family protein